MKLLVEWDHFSDAGLDSTLMLATASSTLLCATSLNSVAHKHVELSNFVGVLARSWHFDRPCPVEIAVTQCEGQLLDLQLGQ